MGMADLGWGNLGQSEGARADDIRQLQAFSLRDRRFNKR